MGSIWIAPSLVDTDLAKRVDDVVGRLPREVGEEEVTGGKHGGALDHRHAPLSLKKARAGNVAMP
jgi:hypothetical protein